MNRVSLDLKLGLGAIALALLGYLLDSTLVTVVGLVVAALTAGYSLGNRRCSQPATARLTVGKG